MGNLVVAIVAETRLSENQAYEYLLFAGFISLATVMLILFIRLFGYDENCNKINSLEQSHTNAAFL